MISSYRFAFLATGIAATLGLSACQPATESTEAIPTEEVAPQPVEAVPETDSADEVEPEPVVDEGEAEETVEDIAVTNMLNDYDRAMSRMNDEMLIGMGYNDPDTAFAKSMLGHHRGAVDMAQIQLKYGTDADMRKLAQEIIDTQRMKIDTMRRWLASHPDAANPKPNTEALQQAFADDISEMNEDMVEGLKSRLSSPVADVAFARSILAHQMGAVDMALAQLKYGTDEEMRDLALQIIGAQQRRVQLTENWLAAHDTLVDDTLINDTLLNKNELDDDAIEDKLIDNDAET